MRDDRSRLFDMLEAITNIEEYAAHGKRRFNSDKLIRTYIVHPLQVLGEAAYKLSADIRLQHPDVPWPQILGMRHAIVHDYFRVDYEIVWGVVESDLPPLKAQIQSMLSELGEPLR